MKPQYETLSALAERYNKLLLEEKKLLGLKEKLTEERERIINSGEVEDEDQVARACSLQTQLLMIPRRLEQLHSAMAEQKPGLYSAADSLRGAIETACDARIHSSLRHIAKVFRDLAGESASPESLAQAVFWQTRLGDDARPFTQRALLGAGGSEPFAYAEEMLRSARAFQALKPV